MAVCGWQDSNPGPLLNFPTLLFRYFCELLNLCLALHHCGAGNLAELKEPLESLKSVLPKNRHFQDVKKAFNKVALLLDVKLVTHEDKKRFVAEFFETFHCQMEA